MRESKPFGKRRTSSKEELDKVIKDHAERNSKNVFDDVFGLTRNSKAMSAFFADRQEPDRQEPDEYIENTK
mgnify:CR=1 FL=1